MSGIGGPPCDFTTEAEFLRTWFSFFASCFNRAEVNEFWLQVAEVTALSGVTARGFFFEVIVDELLLKLLGTAAVAALLLSCKLVLFWLVY